jgi:endonuclease/exonuclease/phosphatase family metal-dependent hydrolase
MMKVTIPTSLKDITLRQYKKFLNISDNLKENDRFVNAKLIEIFCKIPLEQVMRLKLTDSEDYIVLTGDFNLSDNSRPIINLQSNFNDTNKSLKKTDKSYGTFNSFKLNFDSKNRIDYIFEKNFKLIDSRHILVKTPDGRWASDHNPVLAKLKL